MSLQSALLGYLLSLMLRFRISPQENVVLQTTAAATGTMPLAAGFVGILPALGLLEIEKDGSPPVTLSWVGAVGWSCAVAFFGVFLSPPIRKQVIIKEQLRFPSGTATAQLIAVLHDIPPPGSSARRRKGYRALSANEDIDIPDTVNPEEAAASNNDSYDEERETVRQEGWTTLGWSFLASAVMTLTSYFFPIIFNIPLFGTYLATGWLWTFTPSLSYVGQGIIMGFPTALSMNLGMLVGWGILSPMAKYSGWAPGPVGDMTNGARGWILWVSLAIMVSDSVTSLVPVAREIISKGLTTSSGIRLPRTPNPADNLNHDIDAGPQSDEEVETGDRLVPKEWVIWGLGISVILGTVLVWLVFGHEGIKPWATLIGFAMGGLLSILGVRALGETDLNPVSGLGKISQLLFAFIQPGNVVANVIAGGVAEAGAMQAGDLMQDLKTGHLLHASPRAQFYGQLVGSALSIFVTTTAYNLYTRAYPIPGPQFPAPTAYVWLSLARLLRNGQLPEQSANFMFGFALFFCIISAIKTRANRHRVWYAKWIPSGVAFAIGFLNTPSFSLARLVGGVIEYMYHRRWARDGGDIRLIIVASGFVLGEGVISVVSLVLRTFGVGVVSCLGCAPGLCPGCST
ncbi:OPT oligopeptide transporter [Rickenella mellea]|uniref:OPT oligopeptide transporter n=1 Tax=Rickenella mellea TaxID=50990 RepID=A0A4Y7PGD8_9AGAM|nr:OPT oligopeptide transporter [Rickenella mellea]